MKKILIIGNQGYLGSKISDYLLEQGYDCTGADIGFFKFGLIYQPKSIKMLNKEARTIDESDIAGFDVVIQLAGISNDPVGNLDPEMTYNPTRTYALRIALICKKLGVRYIFPSSCSVYGLGGNGLLDETSSVSPQTHYSINKIQIEEDLAMISDETFSPIALRLATVFGMSPRIRFDVVINMLCGMAISENQIVLNSNGLAWRPHLYIDDVCVAFHRCIEWDYRGGKLMILNIGRSDNNWKIIDVAKFIEKSVPGCKLKFLGIDVPVDDLVKDRKIQDGVDTRNYQVSFDKVVKTLPGFDAKWTVEAGVLQLMEDLSKFKVDYSKFKQRDFYRLQQIEYLFANGKIDNTLQWN